MCSIYVLFFNKNIYFLYQFTYLFLRRYIYTRHSNSFLLPNLIFRLKRTHFKFRQTLYVFQQAEEGVSVKNWPKQMCSCSSPNWCKISKSEYRTGLYCPKCTRTASLLVRLHFLQFLYRDGKPRYNEWRKHIIIVCQQFV